MKDRAEFLFQLNLQLEVWIFRELEVTYIYLCSNQGSYKIIDSRLLLNISRSEHAGMTLVCSVGTVRLDL